jgi:hypothetical protein
MGGRMNGASTDDRVQRALRCAACRRTWHWIAIKILDDDHSPPPLHGEYGEYEVFVNTTTLAILGGSLPARALGMGAE